MNHKDLVLWQRSVDLVVETYHYTKSLPDHERYGLILQSRRSAISVSSNIAEGCGRGTDNQILYFLNISLGSLSELETQLIIANRIYSLDYAEILESVQAVRKLIIGTRKFIQRKNK